MHRERFLGELTIDVALGPSCAALFSAVALDDVGNLPIEIAAFGIRKELLVGVLGGTLERNVHVPRPDALKIRLVPERLQCRSAVRDRRQSRPEDRQRCDHNGRQHAGQHEISSHNQPRCSNGRSVRRSVTVSIVNSVSISFPVLPELNTGPIRSLALSTTSARVIGLRTVPRTASTRSVS